MDSERLLQAIGASEWDRHHALEQIKEDCEEERRLVARVLCTDSDRSNRNIALEELTLVGHYEDLLAVLDRFRDVEWIVRCAAYSAAATIGGHRARKPLRDAILNERFTTARRWAVTALGDIGLNKQDIEFLDKRLSKERNADVRVAILKALVLNGCTDRRIDLSRTLGSKRLKWIEPAFAEVEELILDSGDKVAIRRLLTSIKAQLDFDDLFPQEKKMLAELAKVAVALAK